MKYSRLLLMLASFIIIPLFSYLYLTATGFYENRPTVNKPGKKLIVPAGKVTDKKDAHHRQDSARDSLPHIKD
ncbi:MAG: hypothetical protein SFU21_01940 [Flavihumibacter sp.]|nr:hypothetical protein [Flavihumibacter sp.]